MALFKAKRLIPWLILLTGCTSQPFCSYRDTAPVYVLPVPDDLAGSFGEVLVEVEMSLDDVEGPATYLAISGGPGSQSDLYRLNSGEDLSVARSPVLSSICDLDERGRERDDCFRRPGAGFGYRSSWTAGGDEGTECLVVGMAGVTDIDNHIDYLPGLGFWCGVGRVHDQSEAPSQSFIEFEQTDDDVRVIDTFLANGQERIFVGTDSGLRVLEGTETEVRQIQWAGDSLPSFARAVHALDSVPLTESVGTYSGGVLVALGMGLEGSGDVLIGGYEPAATAGDPATLVPMACIHRDTTMFGSVVKLTPLTPGGDLRLIVSSVGEPTREEAAHIYEVSLGADPAAVTCGSPEPWVTLACAEVINDRGDVVDYSADCTIEGAQFGSAIDVGNIDDTEAYEVVVGAPGTQVDGYDRAGAAYIFRPETNGSTPIGLLTEASPTEGIFDENRVDYRLGAAVAVANVGGREEIIISSPGGGDPSVMMFLCTDVGVEAPLWDSPRNRTGSLVDGRCRDSAQ